MPALKAFAAKAAAFLRDMADSAAMIYAEKGMEPFKKPLLISLAVIMSIYYLVYSPVQSRISARKAELEKWNLIQTHFADYESAGAKIREYQDRLPLAKDKEEWLSNLINSTAIKYGMAVDSLSAQTESEIGNYLMVSREVSLTTTYSQLGKWLADIERTPAYVRVAAAIVSKMDGPAHNVNVKLKLSTVFRKADEGQGQI